MALEGEPGRAFFVVIANARAYVAQKAALLVSGQQGTSEQVIDDRSPDSTSNARVHGR